MKIGFIGCGGIVEAVVTGLVEHGGFQDAIFVSKRSEARSTRLAARFKNVSVLEHNQEIINEVDVVFLAVLPQKARPLMRELKFRSGQIVASMVAAIKLDELAELMGSDLSIHRLIPMPPIEIGLGPVPICPPSAELESLFSAVGTPVPLTDESSLSSFTCVSSGMACFFEMVAKLAEWSESQGVDAAAATTYTTSLFGALAGLFKNSDAATLRGMSEECLTPGGLNEQVLNELREAGWFETYLSRFDNIRARIENM